MSGNPEKKFIPELAGSLRRHSVQVPPAIYQASGINIMGTRIKSLLFTTDVAIICNNNAQSILCVYPFTPQINIHEAIINLARCPVFVGVGGGITSGERVISIALQSELLGAYGVVVNVPMPNAMIKRLKAVIDIPLIATIGSFEDDIAGKLEAGADILNISAAANTPALVSQIRRDHGQALPLIATGGPTEETILRTIEAGANAITYTPPTNAELLEGLMKKYREQKGR